MEFASLGIASVATITVICLLFGWSAKAAGIDGKWIPIICGAAGGVFGVLALYIWPIPDFPATDCITAFAVGIASGFAATGVNQVYKQMTGG